LIQMATPVLLLVNLVTGSCPNNPLCLTCQKINNSFQCISCQKSKLNRQTGECMEAAS